MKQLPARFKAARLTRGLSLEDLARQTGYRDARKVAARIGRFECDGTVKDELLSRLTAALDLEGETIEALEAEEAARRTLQHDTHEPTNP
jgi:transcriptional regulator with XRE-family HTH domain